MSNQMAEWPDRPSVRRHRARRRTARWRPVAVGLVVATAVSVATGAGIVSASAGTDRATPGAAGLGDRLFPGLGNGGYDVRDYDLRLRYPGKDPAQDVAGDVTITAVATQDLSRFDLDFAGRGPARVEVDGRPAAFTRDGDELVVTPRTPPRRGREFTVVVSGFEAVPKRVTKPEDLIGLIATPDGTVLFGQPSGAHQLFPGNDHPSDKATYTITMDVPEGWTGTANGVPVRSGTAGGRTVSVFRQNQPMATELVQVAAGAYEVRDRTPVGRVRVRDVVPRADAAGTLPKLAVERDQIAWMQSQVGPYPFDVYGSLVMSVDMGAALETQTMSVFGTPVVDWPAGRREATMAHELAHQWFGDSVSPAQWSDVWLNEGHASWYETLWAEKTGGAAEVFQGLPDREAFFRALYGVSDELRAEFGPVARPKSGDKLFDLFNDNVYLGGSLALYAVRQEIGGPAFERLERTWVTAYRGRSASTEDFIRLASTVAGRDLRPFLSAWLYDAVTPPMPGHPDWKTGQPPASAEREPVRLR